MVVDSLSFRCVRGLVSPAEFMPVINTSSISERIAAWVLETGEAAQLPPCPYLPIGAG